MEIVILHGFVKLVKYKINNFIATKTKLYVLTSAKYLKQCTHHFKYTYILVDPL